MSNGDIVPLHGVVPRDDSYVVAVGMSQMELALVAPQAEAENAPVEPPEAPEVDEGAEEPLPMTSEQKVEDFKKRHGFGTLFSEEEPDPVTPTPEPTDIVEAAPEPALPDIDVPAPTEGEDLLPAVEPEVTEEDPGPREPDSVPSEDSPEAVLSDASPNEAILAQRVQDLEQALVAARVQSIEQMQRMEVRVAEAIGKAAREVAEVATDTSGLPVPPGAHGGLPGIIGDYVDVPEYDPENLKVEYTGTTNEFHVRGGTWSYQDGDSVSIVNLGTTNGEKQNVMPVTATDTGGIYAKLDLTGTAAFSVVFSDIVPVWEADIYYLRLAKVDATGALSNVWGGNIGPTVLSVPEVPRGTQDLFKLPLLRAYLKADDTIVDATTAYNDLTMYLYPTWDWVRAHDNGF